MGLGSLYTQDARPGVHRPDGRRPLVATQCAMPHAAEWKLVYAGRQRSVVVSPVPESPSTHSRSAAVVGEEKRWWLRTRHLNTEDQGGGDNGDSEDLRRRRG